VMLESGRDLETLARDAVKRGADCLGVAGGDGSQAVVAAVAVEHGLPFVCVSAGTRNHFAMDLGLERNDPRQSLGAFRDACERRVDYATVNGRMFINNVSLGVYAAIVHDDSYRDAKVETTMNLLPELIGPHAAPSDLRFVTSDGSEVDAAIAVVVSNNTYTMHGTAVSVKRRYLDRGELGVIAATSHSWHEFTATEFEVQSPLDVVLAGIDGEPVELATPLRFETHRGGLVVLVPRGNVEAAQRRSERDARVRDVIDVALGREPRR
jgi:diacylglycerol kinase family enzyme